MALGCHTVTPATVELPRPVLQAAPPVARSFVDISEATLLDAVLRDTRGEAVEQDQCYAEKATRTTDGVEACIGTDEKRRVAKRQSIPGRGDFVWIDLGTDPGYCAQTHYLLARVHVAAGIVAADAFAAIDFVCAAEPNLAGVAFPDDRGLVIVNTSNSEHGGGDILMIYASEAHALRKVRDFAGTSDEGRAEEGEIRHDEVRATYTAKTVTLDAHIKRSECTRSSGGEDTCRVVEEWDDRHTYTAK